MEVLHFLKSVKDLQNLANKERKKRGQPEIDFDGKSREIFNKLRAAVGTELDKRGITNFDQLNDFLLNGDKGKKVDVAQKTVADKEDTGTTKLNKKKKGLGFDSFEFGADSNTDLAIDSANLGNEQSQVPRRAICIWSRYQWQN